MSRFYPTLSKALIAFFLLTCVCECTVAQPRRRYDPNQGLDEKSILENFNLGRGRYYNYYERGLLLLAQDHYKAAREDFTKALDKKPGDQRDARTYGMHFSDYFPNRELGVVYYFQGELERADKDGLFKKAANYKKAIDYLELSLNQEESSKAKFYLNRARAGFWKTTGADTTPPVVRIANSAIDRWQDPPTLYINKYSAELQIRARDNDSYVGTVWIDSFVNKKKLESKKLFIESAESTFEKDTVVILNENDREKTFRITAVDLAGKESWPAEVRIIVDKVRPLATANVLTDESTLFRRRIPVEIVAVDDRGLNGIRIGDDPYYYRDCNGQFSWKGRFFAEPGSRSLDVEITDRAGNVTIISVNLESGQPMNIGRGDQLIGYNYSPGRIRSPLKSMFDVTRRESGNVLSRLVKFSTLETNSFPPRLGHENLRGQVAYASRILEPESVYSVILAQPGNEYSPRDSAMRLMGRQSSNKENDFKCPWNPDCLYSIILTPLECLYTGNDLKEKYAYEETLNELVLNTLKEFELYKPYKRFNRKALLKGWDAAKIHRNLMSRGYKPWEPRKREFLDKRELQLYHTRLMTFSKRKAAKLLRLVNENKEDKDKIDLALYGVIIKEKLPESYTLTLNIIGHELFKASLLPEKALQVTETKGNLQDALFDKLEEFIPRFIGEIALPPKGKTIDVEFRKSQNLFRHMSLLFYDVSGSKLNPTRLDCTACVKLPRRNKPSIVTIEDCDQYDHIKENLSDVRVVSK